MKKVLSLVAVAILALAAIPASAQVVGSLGGDPGTPYATFSGVGTTACTVGTPCVLTGTVNTATIVGGTVYAVDQPIADIPFGTVGRFLAAGPSSTEPATMTFSQAVDTIGFLWGSPDTYNLLTVLYTGGSMAFTTASLGIAPAIGDQNFSQYVTFNALAGFDLLGLVFSNTTGTDAFEVSNFSRLTPAQTGVVPEPETYALMLAGLAAVGFISRRRRRHQA